MEANTRDLERIFDQTITYQIPLFQRPYVWTQESNLELLWEDIQSLLDKHLRGEKVHPHFMGAVVLEQLSNATASIQSRQVIDGQQRFTTIQLFLLAARDHATSFGFTKYCERFNDLVSNRRTKIDRDDEVFKVWPTNSDRPAFRIVHGAGSPAAIAKIIAGQAQLKGISSNIIEAYRYFHEQLAHWLSGALDETDDASQLAGKSPEDRLESLWQVVKAGLQVVVIDLGEGDETQVIFETLNARGEDLLPADLVKNFLFRKAVACGDDVEKLYESHWQRLETSFWRGEIKQGRIYRPRIDVFFNHYLTLMTRDEVKSSHLFNAFKAFAQRDEPMEGSLIPMPKTPSEHIAQLARYSDIFQTFSTPGSHPRLVAFLDRLDALDTTTVYPFLLYAYAELMPDRQEEFDGILAVLESFLVRRMIVNLTPKGYNRLFVDLIRSVEKSGELSVETVTAFLRKGTGDSNRFPNNEAVGMMLAIMPLYGRLPQYKIRVILEALDAAAQAKKSEVYVLPTGLTIEHVMPQKWETFWPLPVEVGDDPASKEKAAVFRAERIDRLGNLTLINSSLNPSLSHSSWALKRPDLLMFSKLNLNQYFHSPGLDSWDEAAIEARGIHLIRQIFKIWPSIVDASPPSAPAADAA